MTWMNEYEVDDYPEWVGRVAESLDTDLPNLLHLAESLVRFKDWVNSHSDGWPYWRPPQKAASALSDRLQEERRRFYTGYGVEDVSDADKGRLLRPIRAFLRKQGVDPDEIVPLRPKVEDEPDWPTAAELKIAKVAREMESLPGVTYDRAVSVLREMIEA